MSDSAPAVAPDLETLYDLETAVESACQKRLVQLGVNQVQAQQGTGNQTSGRVDVWLTLGMARGSSYIPNNLPMGSIDSRDCFENAWNATLCFNVVTNRDKALPGAHRKFVAKVRILMAQFFSQFPEASLPFHDLADARSAGTTPGLESEKMEDMTQLRYACVVHIRNTAWPAPY